MYNTGYFTRSIFNAIALGVYRLWLTSWPRRQNATMQVTNDCALKISYIAGSCIRTSTKPGVDTCGTSACRWDRILILEGIHRIDSPLLQGRTQGSRSSSRPGNVSIR
jgi:hypothetical protein